MFCISSSWAFRNSVSLLSYAASRARSARRIQKYFLDAGVSIGALTPVTFNCWAWYIMTLNTLRVSKDILPSRTRRPIASFVLRNSIDGDVSSPFLAALGFLVATPILFHRESMAPHAHTRLYMVRTITRIDSPLHACTRNFTKISDFFSKNSSP